MNIPVDTALLAAKAGFPFALVSVGVASAPGWKELRWFALLAATAAGYELFEWGPPLGSDLTLDWLT